MKIGNLKRASEIHEMLLACKQARKELAADVPVTINGVVLPHPIAYRIIQVLNVEINALEKEAEGL